VLTLISCRPQIRNLSPTCYQLVANLRATFATEFGQYPTRNVSGVLVSLELVDKPLKSVMHGQCDAKPTVTFPATGHRYPVTGTDLYCLVTDAYVCKQLAQGRYIAVERPEVELVT